MEKKNVVFLTVLAIATLLTAVVGTTFAYFTAQVNGNNTATTTTVTTASNLTITYSDGDQIGISNAVPGAYSATKTITITNNNNIDSAPIAYQISWANVSNSFVQGGNLTTDDLVYSLTKLNTTTNQYDNVIGTDNDSYHAVANTAAYTSSPLAMVSGKACSVTGGKATITANASGEIVVAPVPVNNGTDFLAKGTLAKNQVDTYKLTVYYLETGINQNENQSSNAHCSDSTQATESACEQAAGTCDPSTYTTYSDCTSNGGEWTSSNTWYPANTVTFSARLQAAATGQVTYQAPTP